MAKNGPFFDPDGDPLHPSDVLCHLRRRFAVYGQLAHAPDGLGEVSSEALAEGLWEFGIDLEAGHSAIQEWERRQRLEVDRG